MAGIATPVQYCFNCWKLLKLVELQRKDEISLSVNGGESEENLLDGIRLNPKYYENGQSAAKPRIEEGSTTIPHEGSTC